MLKYIINKIIYKNKRNRFQKKYQVNFDFFSKKNNMTQKWHKVFPCEIKIPKFHNFRNLG